MDNIICRVVRRLGVGALMMTLLPAGAALTPEELAERSAEAVKENYPDAETVLLYEREAAEYRADGTEKWRDESYTKILTEFGRRDAGTATYRYNRSYGAIEFELAEIIRADGTKVPVDVKSGRRDMTENSQMESNIYDPAQRVCTLGIPGLEVGDILHTVVSGEEFKTRMPGMWCGLYPVQSTQPVKEYVLSITAPEQLPLRSIAVKDDTEKRVNYTSRKKEDGGTEHIWTVKEMPRFFKEPEMPEWFFSVPRIMVSSEPDWKTVSRWYYKLCRPHLDAVSDEMRAKVTELTAGAADDNAKIRALFQFVSQQVRYVGLTAESEAPGNEPHDVSLTFSRRHGVCRDKAALLAAMLELAGFNAFPVLFMAGPPKDKDVPNIYFNHAITGVKLPDGTLQLMDPTFETTGDLLPSELSNMSYLPATREGDTLRRSPVVPAENNRLRIHTEMKLDEYGILTGHTRMEFAGVNDRIYRTAFSKRQRAVWDNPFASRLKELYPDAELRNFKVEPEDVRDTSQPLSVEFDFRKAGFSPRTDGEFLLQTPDFGAVIGASAGKVTGDTALRERRFPKIFPTTCGTEESFRWELPSNCRIKAVPTTMRAAVGEYCAFSSKAIFKCGREYNYDAEANRLEGKSCFTIDGMEMPATEYPALRKALGELDLARRTLPAAAMEYPRDGAVIPDGEYGNSDSLPLATGTVLETEDGVNWTLTETAKRKILNYGGVKRYSEIKVNFNPAWEEAEISAEVTAPDGTKTVLKPDSVNLMDQKWTAAAPRYPAGKILVANLPDVRPGSLISVKTVRKRRTEQMGFLKIFGDTAPGAGQTFTVITPENTALNLPKASGLNYSEEKRDGRIYRTWSRSGGAAFADDPGSPPQELYRPAAAVSTFDLKILADSLRKGLTAAAEKESPLAAEKARQLTAGCATPAEKVTAIRDFAAENIRQAGPALNEIPENFSDPDETLRSGYGNSADRAVLLGAMLKAAGFEYRFAAVSGAAWHPLTAAALTEVPRNIFTAVLVEVPEPGCILNNTGRYDALGAIGEENRIALNLETGELFQPEPAAGMRTAEYSVYRIKPDKAGGAEIECEETLTGRAAAKLRRGLAEMTPEELRRFKQSLAAAFGPAAELDGELRQSDEGGALKVNYTVKNRKFAAVNGVYLEMPLPEYGKFADELGIVKPERANPFWRGTASETGRDYIISLPEGYMTAGRRPYKLTAGGENTVSYEEHCSENNGTIEIRCRMKCPVELVPALDFDRRCALRGMLAQPSMGKIMLKKSPEADSR